MNTIVLVCIGNFQEYIMTNIVHLVNLGHTPEQIHVVISRNIEHEFEPLQSFITIAYADDLEDEFDFNNKSQLDRQFRGGFWHYTSARMFVLYAYMKATGLRNVVHLENDVLIYYNVSTLNPWNSTDSTARETGVSLDSTARETGVSLDSTARETGVSLASIYMPFDSYKRNIASIMLIPDANTLGKVLASYDYTQNDMYNFAKHVHKDLQGIADSLMHFASQNAGKPFLQGIANFEPFLQIPSNFNTNIVKKLPICVPMPGMTEEQLWVSDGLNNPFIFDAAALGQMVGGVDPRNIAGDTRGFVNEECVIKYNDYGTIVWINFKPYYRLHIKGIAMKRDIPIFNLHIHSKNLYLYTNV